MLIVCPHCHTPNRLTPERLNDHGTCGRCKAPLFVGEPMALDQYTFDKHLQRSELPLIVDFWAPWCGPCQSMAPAFALACQRLEPRCRLAKVNTEAEPGLAGRFAIRAIPTLILFRNGQEQARHSGALSTEGIIQWANTHA